MRFYAELKDNFLRYFLQRRRERRIVKFVRANMMLSWLQEKLHARVVFIIRHPAPTIMSQMRSPRSWHPHFRIDIYRKDRRLLDALDDSTRKFLFQRLEDVEAYTLSWCIENTMALRQAAEGDMTVIYYENLVVRGAVEWQRIMSALALDKEPDHELIAQPSQQTHGEKVSEPTLLRDLASWKDRIEPSTADRIQDVLNVTGMTAYNVQAALPMVDLEAEGSS